jgi:hypothetical protein
MSTGGYTLMPNDFLPITGASPDDTKSEFNPNLKGLIKGLNELLKGKDMLIVIDTSAGVMGNYKISRGVDEKGHFISYYDKWKLDIGPEKNGGFIGKPFEIYDRIYYNPETFEPIEVSK